MKSFVAISYVVAAVRSTGVAVQFPAASVRTADVTRPPAGSAMSYVKQRPETCGKRPFTLSVATTFPNGSTVSTWPRVIRNGGWGAAGQKPGPPPAAGHVSASRSPPEFVIANWTPIDAYVDRIASVTTLPTRDSHVRPAVLPHWSVRGIAFVEFPITVPRIGWSSAFSSLILAWIAGSGVTPIAQGLWKSAV